MGKKGDGGGERLREEDLLIEVLSRLDANTLLQCKSVCKTWYSLISNPTFIKSHLNRALTSTCTNNKTTLIVRLFKTEPWQDCPEEDGSFSLFDLGGCDDFVKHLKFPYSKGDYPFTPPSLLIGCVCGIVCVCVDPYADSDAIWCESTANKLSDIYIWNPATKQSKLVPAHTLHHCDDTIKAALGFGFDPIDFDFKVVRVLSKDIFPEVYSVNRNVWCKIEAKLSDIPNSSIFEICLHGFLFAIGRYNGMIAFNLNKEVFICDIEFPIRSNETCIADFKDSIAVIIFNFEEKDDRIKLWTLDDEACLRGVGVKASWTMMLTIDVGMGFDWIFGLFNSVEFLLKYDDWLSYNFGKKFWRYLNPNPFFEFEKVFKYTESLLPVAGSKLVNWSDGKDDEESSGNLEDDNEDNYEESSIAVCSEDDYEESTAETKVNEESNIDSEDDNEEKRVDSGDE